MEEKIPYEMLNDIVLTFLLGIDNEYVNACNKIIPNTISDHRIKYIVEWKDLFKLRSLLINRMSESADKKLIILANVLKDIHDRKNTP